MFSNHSWVHNLLLPSESSVWLKSSHFLHLIRRHILLLLFNWLIGYLLDYWWLRVPFWSVNRLILRLGHRLARFILWERTLTILIIMATACTTFWKTISWLPCIRLSNSTWVLWGPSIWIITFLLLMISVMPLNYFMTVTLSHQFKFFVYLFYNLHSLCHFLL